jgi:hypothetical protein
MGKQFKVLKYHPNPRSQLNQIRFGVTKAYTIHNNLARLKRLEGIHGFDEGGFTRA